MTVYFIGAGPGDPELITVKGQRLIRECPLVLYAGSLVPKEVVLTANPAAEIVNTADLSLDEIIARIRAARPDIALSSDFIVGFPGETEADFEATLDLIREVKFVQAYSFKYSPRPGTPASTRGEQVPEEVKTERLHRLQALLSEQSEAFNAACAGKVLPVLFDRKGRNAGQLLGRSPYLQPVHIDAGPDELLGHIAPVIIEQGFANSLRGRLAESEKVIA